MLFKLILRNIRFRIRLEEHFNTLLKTHFVETVRRSLIFAQFYPMMFYWLTNFAVGFRMATHSSGDAGLGHPVHAQADVASAAPTERDSRARDEHALPKFEYKSAAAP